jgi:hypothetical protein
MGDAIKGSACYTTDGLVFWSYSTCVAVVDTDRRVISFNVTRYSATTNRWVQLLRHALPAKYPGFWIFEADPGVFHVQPDILAALARGDQPDDKLGDTVDDLVNDGALPENRAIKEAHIEYNRYGFGHVKHARSTLL